jgi:phage tail sheath protein FI
MLRLCAARGDVFAVLALPEHYREDDAIFHAQTLTTESSGFFGPEEARTLSFGALYHPWLIGQEENRSGELRPDEIRRTPPDGAMTGIIAQRTLARGAWIAPANEFLKGVVALTPAIDRSRWLDLQDAQLNVIRHEPKGFTAMNSDTLSTDEELRPINVRRLLILLRRLALRLGATYVFEPNSDAFRRSVQRGFEAMLDGMFLRGAFAGPTAATSYQVVTDTSVNTPQSIDQGRFIVELRVAPSLPLTFLTIRLVQTGDRALVTQET